jgi:predicted nucleic acid-binding protein
MTRIYVGPTVVYSLGQVGELSLMSAFDGEVVIPETVVEASTVEPTATNLTDLLDGDDVRVATDYEGHVDSARALLGEKDVGSALSVLAGILAHRDPEDRSAVAVVSEDRTVRRMARGLGAEVTSSFGVVVRATLEDKYLSPSQAKRIVRRIDQHGMHLTGELRERAVGEITGSD